MEYTCPHCLVTIANVKTRTKMLNDIKYSFNIDLRKSIMYGNEDKDELFAKFKLKNFTEYKENLISAK